MWLIIGLMLFFSYPVDAAVCVEDNVLKCAELGFTENSCENGGVACYYDPSKWYCAKWTCWDGRYYDAENRPDDEEEDVECVEVSYKGLTCYNCYYECPLGTVDYQTCWNKKLYDIVFAPTECEAWGYIHEKDNCINYLACPSDYSKVRCFD